jgi:hypothetical protein
MSNIVSATIDENFPVAGQDNDSQGFRDNFNIIKVGLATAASEVTDLQNTTAKLNVANNFNGTLISNAEVSRLYSTALNHPDSATVLTIDYALGDYHEVTITANATLNIAGFPDQPSGPSIEPGKRVYAKIRLALKGDGAGEYNVNITSNGVLEVKQNFSTTISIPNDDTTFKIVDVWTADNSKTLFIQEVGTFT